MQEIKHPKELQKWVTNFKNTFGREPSVEEVSEITQEFDLLNELPPFNEQDGPGIPWKQAIYGVFEEEEKTEKIAQEKFLAEMIGVEINITLLKLGIISPKTYANNETIRRLCHFIAKPIAKLGLFKYNKEADKILVKFKDF